jgi:chromosome segregation ATPase
VNREIDDALRTLIRVRWWIEDLQDSLEQHPTVTLGDRLIRDELIGMREHLLRVEKTLEVLGHELDDAREELEDAQQAVAQLEAERDELEEEVRMLRAQEATSGGAAQA